MISIAIDGPAGAGKSTIARKVASKIGATYIDTGAMYRALTYLATKNMISYEQEDELVALLDHTQINLVPTEEGQEVYLDGERVTNEIRSPQISQNVSIVAKHPKVRQIMVEKQKALAKQGAVVMDGRDIGTAVLPNATVKIFLTASVEERARRRYLDLVQKGYSPELEKLKLEIEERDHLDSNREISPLKKAEDAVEIDTTHLTIEQVVEKILHICQRVI